MNSIQGKFCLSCIFRKFDL